LEGGVEHQVGVVTIQAPRAEGVDLAVELFADPADLILGDALETERVGEVVNGPGADAVDVRLLDHREQRALMAPAWLQKAREVGALTQLGDLQLDRADPGVPFPVPVAVALSGAALGPLVRRGPHELGDLGVHQLLRQKPDAVTQELGVGALVGLVEELK
jgi:hypothetical protein